MNKLWAYFKTKDFLRNFLGAIGVVIGVVLIVFFSLGYYTRHGSGIPVPAVTGLPVERAIETLKSQGFEIDTAFTYVTDKPGGTVTEQDPDAGTNVKEGRVIYLTVVSRVAPNVALPDLSESTYLEAVAKLANNGLKVGDTTYRADIAHNKVLEVKFSGQILKAGTKVPKGSRLDLVLGNGAGSAEQEIPNLMDMDLDAARMAIRGIGLTMGNIIYKGPITDSTNLVVIQQFPMPTDSTSKTSIGTRVNLTVTQGKKTDGPQH